MIKTYIKKPIPIEAIQWTGDNEAEILKFSRSARFVYHETCEDTVTELYIHTLEGDMYAKVGDYIIKGVAGETYPCAQLIFERTYEEVPE